MQFPALAVVMKAGTGFRIKLTRFVNPKFALSPSERKFEHYPAVCETPEVHHREHLRKCEYEVVFVLTSHATVRVNQ